MDGWMRLLDGWMGLLTGAGRSLSWLVSSTTTTVGSGIAAVDTRMSVMSGDLSAFIVASPWLVAAMLAAPPVAMWFGVRNNPSNK